MQASIYIPLLTERVKLRGCGGYKHFAPSEQRKKFFGQSRRYAETDQKLKVLLTRVASLSPLGDGMVLAGRAMVRLGISGKLYD